MSTAKERLEQVRAEIAEVLSKGQRVRRDGRELNRADLAGLRMLEAEYAKQAQREQAATNGRPRIVRLQHGGKGIHG